jgi:hypothetical protein
MIFNYGAATAIATINDRRYFVIRHYDIT